MTADAATVPTTYGIVQTPFARETIKHANASAQLPLMDAITDLQGNPRPEGHEPADAYGEGYAAIVVRSTSPAYQIIYCVDDDTRRVTVIAIAEARWKT
jgi:mRNA-degrading endonuclease RelE of RelBE toxin-antitoxin system